jgi:hypothetical protein
MTRRDTQVIQVMLFVSEVWCFIKGVMNSKFGDMVSVTMIGYGYISLTDKIISNMF